MFSASGHKKAAAQETTHHTFPPLLPSHETGVKDGGRCSEKHTTVFQNLGMVDRMVSLSRPTLVSLYTVQTGVFRLSETEKGSPGCWRNTVRTICVK